MIPSEQALPAIVSRLLKSNSCNYSVNSLAHIIAVTKILNHIPFKAQGGMMMPPNMECIFVFTDSDDITDWQLEHQEYTVGSWHNPEPSIMPSAGVGARLGRGRPSKLRQKEMKHLNRELARSIIAGIADGRSQRSIARELGISPPRVSQIKKQWDAGFYLDMQT
jgi:hypothetical protein